MTFLKALDEWSRRRYWPLKVWYQHKVPYGVTVDGDPYAPPKGMWTGWRRKWSWALADVSPNDVELAQTGCLYPGYSLDDGQSFRHILRPLRTRRFAFQVGPKPVMFSVFAKNGDLVDVNVTLIDTGLTWSQVIRVNGDREAVTFV